MNARSSSNSYLPHALIFSGSLPFIAGALLLLVGFDALPLLGKLSDIISAYGLVIVIFLTGIHWGQQLSLGKAASGLFISSNLLAVLVWLAWLVMPDRYFLVFLSVPLVVMLVIDRGLYRAGVINRDYVMSRAIITGIVIISLFLSASSL